MKLLLVDNRTEYVLTHRRPLAEVHIRHYRHPATRWMLERYNEIVDHSALRCAYNAHSAELRGSALAFPPTC